jgi:hypothetical protein
LRYGAIRTLKDIKLAFFTSLRDPMVDLARSERAKVMSELKGIPIFSKVDDVEELDKRVRAIL